MVKKLKSLGITLLLITILFTNLDTAIAQSELDQYCEETNSYKWTNTNEKCYAQTFTPTKEYMTKIQIKINRTNIYYNGWSVVSVTVRHSLNGEVLRGGYKLLYSLG